MEQELRIIINAVDNASQELNSVADRAKALKPTFRKMAGVGTATFGAVATSIGLAVREAGKAEKIGENFETTFGESSDALRAFIQDFSSEFAFVERELEKSATSIGFQLNNMGDIGAEEGQRITETMLTAAGGLSDFFGEQMNVEQAADAMAKGLSGSRQQLQQMGFSAYADDIKEMAASMGFNTEELTKSQEALALTEIIMRETQGSVQGMKDDTDSYARMQRELRTATIETTQALGDVFLPMATDLLEAITPIVREVAGWIEENEELAKWIGIITLAVSGVVAVVGALGLVVIAITAAMSPWLLIIGAVVAAVVALVAAGIYFWKNWDKIKIGMQGIWETIKNVFKAGIDFIKSYIVPLLPGGALVMGLINNWEAISSAFSTILDSIVGVFEWASDKIMGFLDPIINAAERAISLAKKAASLVGGSIGGAVSSVGGMVRSITPFADGGIVTGPTVGLIGEEQPEAVIPLDKMGGETHVHLDIDKRTVATVVMDQISGNIKSRMAQ